MALLAQAFARKSAGNFDVLRELLGRRTSASGKVVNVKTAIEVAAVFACMRVIANGIAQVPFKLMRESADGKSRLPAKDHPLYEILGCRPNEWQTSFEYREMLAMHLVLCGNAYSFVNRSNRSGIMELIPFEPGSVTVKRADDFTLTYEVRSQNGRTQPFPAKAIWHLRGPSWNSWMGLEAVTIAREAIGLSLAIEEQQARMQKNGVQASGVYSVEGTLKDDQYKALKKWIDDNLAGSDNAGKAMLLDRNAKWMNTSMTGIDAQTLETRRFQVEEVCRHAGVNPIMVFAESKNTTYASAEQMFLAHVVHALSPHYMRIEQSVDANLLTEAERKQGLYSCFVDAGLLRGSITNQKDVVLGYVNGGLMTPNEGRRLLDMNPDADGASDKLRIPANIVGAVPNPDAAAQSSAKALDALRTEIKSAAQPVDRSVNVTFNQEPVALPKQGDVHVTVEGSQINVPEQKAGDVHFNVEPTVVNVPEQKAGDVIVNVPAPAVEVHVEAIMPAKSEMAITSLPDRKTTSGVDRDPATGNIVSTTALETDVK